MRYQVNHVPGMGKHIRVSTRTGFAHIVLNKAQVLVSFYSFDEEPIGGVYLVPREPLSVYDAGWNIDALKWIVEVFQPVIRQNVR